MKTISFALVLSMLAPVAHALDIQPGNWNVEMSLSMGGMAMPANAQTFCLKDVNQLLQGGAGCSVKTASAVGDQVKMAISCNVNGMQMDGTGTFTVAPTKVDGTLDLAMQMGQGPAMQTLTSVHAVRMGDCQAAKTN